MNDGDFLRFNIFCSRSTSCADASLGKFERKYFIKKHWKRYSSVLNLFLGTFGEEKWKLRSVEAIKFFIFEAKLQLSNVNSM